MPFRIAAALLAVVLTLGIAPSAAANATIDAQTNDFRAANKLPPLPTWDRLADLARMRATESTQNFAHPSDWGYLFDRLPSCVTGIGENLAYYSTGQEPAGWPVSAWADSPTHRANMVGTWDWQASATTTADGRTYAVQLFAAGCRDAAQLSITDVAPPRPLTTTSPVAPAMPALPDTAMESPQ